MTEPLATLDAARFFTTDPQAGALLDRNGDGVPDGLRVRLVVDGTPTATEWVELVNLAARLGLETAGLDFPVALPAGAPLPAGAVPLRYRASGGAAPGVLSFAGASGTPALWGAELDEAAASPTVADQPLPGQFDLADLYSTAGALADDDDDRFPERVRLVFVVPPQLPVDVGCAICDVAARLGLESTGVRFPLATALGARRPAGTLPLFVVIAPDKPVDIPADVLAGLPAIGRGEGLCTVVTLHAGEPALLVLGDAVGVARALRELAATWPYLRRWGAGEPAAADLTAELMALLHGEGPRARAALLGADLAELSLDPGTSATVQLLDSDPALLTATTEAVARAGLSPAVTVVATPDDAVAFDDEWTAPWEVDRARQVVREVVLPALDLAQPAEVLVLISEPGAIRQTLAAELQPLLPDGSQVTVLSAFKAGLCWLREIVAPAWRARGDVARVEVSYPPLAEPEPGAPPSLDLPIRWLQELYPGDELLAVALDLPLDAITMGAAPAKATDDGYVAVAFDAVGRECDRRSFAPRSYTRPYLGAYPREGTVTASTGAVIARQAGRVVADVAVPTDFDLFWDYYQETVLPRVHGLILAGADGRPDAAAQPFFAALDVDVWASEPEEALGVREELLSPAEALHEDIYFTTLDSIVSFGAAHGAGKPNDPTPGAEPLDAPGAVRPFVHLQASGGPRARVTLRRRLTHLADLVSPAEDGPTTRRALGTLPTGNRPVARVQWALWRRDVPGVAGLGLTVTSDAGAARAVLSEVARQEGAGSATGERLALTVTVAGQGQDEPITLALPLPVIGYQAAAEGALAPDAARLPLDRVLAAEDLPPLLAELAALPGVTTRRLDRSFEGRALDAIEVVAAPTAAVWSPLKASLYKPTFFVVARHHANEVASTPAALRLARLCATDPAYRPLLDRVNLVLLPLENPDGAALHAAMQREHPNWKLHAARYNAVGLEFGREFSNPATPYGEARVRPALWRRWLPDVVVDNHGVPSHEWNQLFSGFNSPPRFGVSYWLVQALIYGILYYPAESLAHRAFAEALRDRVAAAVAADAALLHGNQVLHERFRTWGHDRLPEKFPATYYQEMLWFFGQQGARRRPLDPAHDRVTSASWVTEVADETAQGEYLSLVAHAQFVANVATLRLLADVAPPVERQVWRGPAGPQLVLRRQRPLPAG